MPQTDRRTFLQIAAAASAAVASSSLFAADVAPAGAGVPASAGERVVLGVMGLGRGLDVAKTFAGLPNVFIKYACDVDDAKSANGVKVLEKVAGANNNTPAPVAIRDFQKVLADPEVHALVIAAPDHWHAPAAILAAAAGKHVYVEKPCCHNPREGELLVAAQKKFNRVIQHGTQRRSYPKNIEAIAKLKDGVIGKVTMARAWYANNRKPIGVGKPAPVPAGLDWSLWQGPAPETEFHDNYVHYNWHWFWQWGTGECGNNGIHALDLCRWGLGVDAPLKVTSSGGRYYYKDDWQTPDTQFVTYDFGDRVIQWEGKSCHPRGVEANSGFGAAFYGDQGSLIIDGPGYTVYDLKNKETAKVTPTAEENTGDRPHMQNFIDAARAGDQSKLNAPIAEGYASVLLCHLANISQRTGRTLHVDPATQQIKDDPEAMKLWSREYRPGWEPKV